jgi:hypothetical protein
MRYIPFFVFLSLLLAIWGLGQDAEPPTTESRVQESSPLQVQNVSIRSWPSKTALWVGDEVVYTVEIECAPGVDILAEDLGQDRVLLEGLEMLGQEVEQIGLINGGRRYRIRYHLACYEVDRSNLKVSEIQVRYYLQGEGGTGGDALPGGIVMIPSLDLAFRSTLPDSESYFIRDLWFPSLDSKQRIFQGAGLALLALSIGAAILWGGAYLRNKRPTQSIEEAKERRRADLSALDELKRIEVAEEETKRESYRRLDTIVRNHLEGLGVPARFMTPAEIEEHLLKQDTSLPVTTLANLLQECELAKYATSDHLPTAEQWKQTLLESDRIVTGSSR